MHSTQHAETARYFLIWMGRVTEVLLSDIAKEDAIRFFFPALSAKLSKLLVENCFPDSKTRSGFEYFHAGELTPSC